MTEKRGREDRDSLIDLLGLAVRHGFLGLDERVEFGCWLTVRTSPAIAEGEVLRMRVAEGQQVSLMWRYRLSKRNESTNLAVVASEVEVMKGVMSGSVDDLFQEVTGDHIRVVDLQG